MSNWKVRTELLIGKDGIKKLAQASVLIVGAGGVGSFAAEYICRAGVGKITIADFDVVDSTNRNRQLIALVSTIGRSKVEVLTERLRDINPDAKIIPVNAYLKDEKIPELIASDNFDYVVDAIDTLSPKVHLIQNCIKQNIKLVSSMGSGGKLDPSKVHLTDISKTHNCPLARALRKRLHRLGITKGFKAVFSTEGSGGEIIDADIDTSNKRSVIGTISYMPSLFGCYCASTIIRDLLFFK
jgi:tRNA A37 threonylcarbamoyladenosine dehydratase